MSWRKKNDEARRAQQHKAAARAAELTFGEAAYQTQNDRNQLAELLREKFLDRAEKQHGFLSVTYDTKNELEIVKALLTAIGFTLVGGWREHSVRVSGTTVSIETGALQKTCGCLGITPPVIGAAEESAAMGRG